MTNIDLVRQRDSLNALVARARDLPDPELLGHWGRYLCVLTAGFLENSIRSLYARRAHRKSSKDVAAFVAKTLDRIQNPKASKFIEVARDFDGNAAEELENFLAEDNARRKNAIDSIMANRHLIAHGRNTSISVARVKEYLKEIVDVVDYIEIHQ